MKSRREIMKECAFGLAGLCCVESAQAMQSAIHSEAAAIPPALAKRIAISTVTFREKFRVPTTNQANAGVHENTLTLLNAPQFIADTLGIHNLELWSMHFENDSLDYCAQVREAAEKSGSKIVNIELDGSYNLSSNDPAERKKSIEFVKGWIDRARALACPRLRPNQQSFEQASAPFNLSTAIDSYRQLTEYARKNGGIEILTKNFVGACLDIDTLIALIKGVNDPLCRLILDWGNTQFDSMNSRLAEFRKAFPYMEMETAKGINFDKEYKLTDYDPAPIIRATERSGFKGIYSIELYSADNPPNDAVRAARTILSALIANMRR